MNFIPYLPWLLLLLYIQPIQSQSNIHTQLDTQFNNYDKHGCSGVSSIAYKYGNVELGWGPIGHSLSAYIAESLLSVDASNASRTILGSDVSLASISSWADSIREHHEWHWTERLHYINTPDWVCDGYSVKRDCSDNVCVDQAIQNYTKQLMRYNSVDATDDSIVNSLKFIVHFLGDIHQPLHVGFTSDEGGNTICGHFDGTHDKLHVCVWNKYCYAILWNLI